MAKKNRRSFQWGVLVLMMVSWSLSLSSPLRPLAADPSVTAPPDVIPAGFAPATAPATGWMDTAVGKQLNWRNVNAKVLDPDARWVAATSGMNLTLYAGFNKWDYSSVAYLILRGQVGDGPVLTLTGSNWNSEEDATNAQALGVSYATGVKGFPEIRDYGAMENDDVRYNIRVPAVSAPTWIRYQVTMQFAAPYAAPPTTRIFQLLALPNTYDTQWTGARILFPGQSSTVRPADLPEDIQPTYAVVDGGVVTATAQRTGGWVVRSQPGAAPGVATFGGTVFVNNVFTSRTAQMARRVIPLRPTQVYTAQLNDQTAPQAGTATFTLDLPAAVRATNVRWYQNGQLIPNATGTQVTLSDLKAEDDQTTVRAVADYWVEDERIGQDVSSNAARLTVTPPQRVAGLTLAPDFLFIHRASDPDDVTSQTRPMFDLPAGATAVSVAAIDPVTKAPSELVSVDANQTITAKATPGTVTVVLRYRVGDQLYVGEQTLTILALSDVQVPAGGAVQLQGPVGLPAPPAGTTQTFHWQVAPPASSTFAPVNVPGSPTTPALTLAQVPLSADGQRYQLVIERQAIVDGQPVTTTWLSNAVALSVTRPDGLAVLEVPSFQFGVTDRTVAGGVRGPTLAEILRGDFTGPTQATPTVGEVRARTLANVNPLVQSVLVSDGRTVANGDWALSVKARTPQAIFTGAALPTDAISIALMRQVDGADTQVLATVAADDAAPAAVLFNGQGVNGRSFTQPLDAAMVIQPVFTLRTGDFRVELEWQLQTAPIAQPPQAGVAR